MNVLGDECLGDECRTISFTHTNWLRQSLTSLKVDQYVMLAYDFSFGHKAQG